MNHFFRVLALILSFHLAPNLLHAQIDQDNDGIPQAWENANGLNDNDPKDAFLDPDGDQILNLQEYILKTDPNISDEAEIFEYDPSTPISLVYAWLRLAETRTVIVRMPQGTYDFSYGSLWINEHKVMLQGGWNDDYSAYDPCRYKTILHTEDNFVFGLGGETNYSGIVLDGLEFSCPNGWTGVLLVSDLNDMDIHVHNCSFYNIPNYGLNVTARYEDQHVEVTLSNVLFYGHAEGGVAFAGDALSTLDIRVINCTFYNPKASWGDIAFARFQSTNSLRLDIQNCIFSPDTENGSLFKSERFQDIYEVNVSDSYFFEPLQPFSVTETNAISTPPIYIDAAGGNFELVATSPLVDRGIDVGLPFEGAGKDIGARESGACDCTLDISCAFYNETAENAADGKAFMTIKEGIAPYNIAWSNGSTQDSITDLAPGKYSATVTDATGCTALCCQEVEVYNERDLLEDTDDDTMPDLWEEEHGLDINDKQDAFCDNDNDQVINLFEYQLGTDPNDINYPPKYRITPTMSETEIKAIINLATQGVVYMRFAEGSYNMTYTDTDSGGLTATEGYRLLMQGGWNSDFSEYDPFEYNTVIAPSGATDKVFKLYADAASQIDTTALILDGLVFTGGGTTSDGIIDVITYDGFVYNSFFNCSFIRNNAAFSSTAADSVDYDLWFINSTFHLNNPFEGIVKLRNQGYAISRLNVYNSNLTNNNDQGVYIQQPSAEVVFRVDLQNSILWGSSNATTPTALFFDQPEGVVNMSIDNLVHNGFRLGINALFTFETGTEYTGFSDPGVVSDVIYPGLRPDSRYKRLGIDIGLPYDGDLPDIGFNEGLRVDPLDVSYAVTKALCGTWSGTITIDYEGENNVEFSIDGENFSEELSYQGLNDGIYPIYVRHNGCATYLGDAEIEDDYDDCGKDTDKDGMKDEYELTHGFDPNDPTDALGDADCDQVLNLFEYMLTSDPNDDSSPVKIPFSTAQTNEAFVRHVVDSQNETILLQLHEGEYDLEFVTEVYFNGPKIPGWSDDTAKRLMIQGGWNDDYTEYNPFCYRTIIDSENDFINFKINYADSLTLVLDGLEMSPIQEQGDNALFAWNFGAVVQYGINNCSFSNWNSAIEFRLDVNAGPLDFFVINSTIADNHHNFDLTLPNGQPHINYNFINSVVTNSDGNEKGLFELQKVGTDSTNLRITNCVFWDDKHQNSTNIFPNKNIYLEVINSIFSDGNASEYSSYTTTNSQDVDPSLVKVGGHYFLPDNSPFLGGGIQTGVPYDPLYDAPHLGVNAQVIRWEEVAVEHTFCNAADGWARAAVCSPMAVEYSLDTIEWQPHPFFSELDAGDYLMHVRSIHCGAELTIPFEIDNQDTDLEISCDGDQAQLVVMIEGGTGPIIVQWNGSQQDTFAVLADPVTGINTVTVTDALGCSVTCHYSFTGCSAFAASCVATDVAGPLIENGSVTAMPTDGAAPYTFLWDDTAASATGTINSLAAGVYSVTVTDSNDCTTTCYAEVKIPLTLSCAGIECTKGVGVEVVAGGVPPYLFQWNDTAGSTTAELNSLEDGEYTVTVTDTEGSTAMCTVSINYGVLTPNSEDSDNDGMPNAWEIANGLDECDPTDAFGDEDCDQVWNLYEFQLESDPRDLSSPIIISIDPETTVSEIESLISDKADPSSALVIRLGQGIYEGEFIYWENLAGIPDRLMIQGGWDLCRMQYDPYLFKSILVEQRRTNEFADPILETIIYDGIEFDRSRIGPDVFEHCSISNCSFYDPGTFPAKRLFFIGLHNNDAQFFFINSSVVESTMTEVVRIRNSITADIHIINSTLTIPSPSTPYAINVFADAGSQVDVFIQDSNMWDANFSGLALGFWNNPVASEMNVYASNSNISAIRRFGSSGVIELDADCTDLDPLYDNTTAPFFELSANSPLLGNANDNGLYESNWMAAIGHNQNISSCVVSDTIEVTADVTPSDCSLSGEPNGVIELNVSGGVAPYMADWSHNPGVLVTSNDDQSELAEGTYSVTVIDSNGCTATEDFQVNELNPQDCFDCDLSLEDSDSDGMPNSWELANGLDECDPVDAYGDFDCDQVYNLYEYLLSADPNNGDSPASILIDANTTTAELQNLINTTNANEGLVVKLEEGIYSALNFQFIEYTGFSENVMVQGGYDCGGAYEPSVYRTILKDYTFNIDPEENTIIYDGLEFDNSALFFNSNFIGFSNCSFYNYNSYMYVNADINDVEFYMNNCTVLDLVGPGSQFAGLLLATQSTGNIEAHIFNSTIVPGNFPNGISCTHVNGATTDLFITGSNIWDASMQSSVNLGLDNGSLTNGVTNVFASNSNFKGVLRNGVAGVTEEVNNIDIDPQFDNRLPPYYELDNNTSLTNSGSENRIYEMGFASLMGHNKNAASCLNVADPLSIDVTEMDSDCSINGVANGVITSMVSGGTAPYEYTLVSDDTGETISNEASVGELVQGSYSLTVTDVSGCIATATTIITELNPQDCGPDCDPTLEDSDNDGMPNTWEIANGLDECDPTDAFGDLDCDQVYNLYEFQLGSDLNDVNSPQSIWITADLSLSEIQNNLLDIDVNRPLIVKFLEGAYDGQVYAFDDFNNLPTRVMFQGGWDCDLEYDPVMHSTVFSYEFSSVFENFGTIIYDGFEFNGVGISNRINSGYASFSNCAFYPHPLLSASITIRSSGDNNELSLFNCSFIEVQNSAVTFSSDYAYSSCKLRMINTTMTSLVPNATGLQCGESLFFSPDVFGTRAEWDALDGTTDIYIKDCNLWDADPNTNLIYVRVPFATGGTYNLFLDNSNISRIQNTGVPGITEGQAELLNLDPLFMNMDPPYFELSPASPLVGLSDGNSLYEENFPAAIGHNQSSQSCAGNPLTISPGIITDSDCSISNESNGELDITVAGGAGTYAYMWSTNNGSGLEINDEDQTGLSEGFYQVTVTDALGCSATTTYTLDELNPQDCVADCDLTLEDSDNDGMPNVWEIANGLDECDPKDAFCDPDGDQVVNLFEYQLDSDPYDETSPDRYEISAGAGPGAILSTIANGYLRPSVIRMEGGTYSFISQVQNANNDFKLMIQGGWSPGFTDYDPFTYETIFNGSANGPVLEYTGGATPTECTYILDGVNFNRSGNLDGAVYLTHRQGVSHFSFYNCIFYDNIGDVDIDLLGPTENHTQFINCAFTNRENLTAGSGTGGGIIRGVVDQGAQADWRILHTTMNRVGTNWWNGLGFLVRTGSTLDLDIINSNIWSGESDRPHSIRFVESSGSIDYSVINSNLSSIFNARTGFTDNPSLNIDPLFEPTDLKCRTVSSSSPLYQAGDDYGVAYDGGAPDIGINKFVKINQSDYVVSVTPASCGLDNGIINIEYVGYIDPLIFVTSYAEYSRDNITFLPSDFENLAPGTYPLWAKSYLDDCVTYLGEFTINGSSADAFLKATSKANCGESNGSITITPPGDISEYTYSLDNETFQSSNVFPDLGANIYVLYYRLVADTTCVVQDFVILNQNSDIALVALDSLASTCGKANGVVTLDVNDAIGTPYFFSKDEAQQDVGRFENLEGGDYVFYVEDEEGCQDSISVTIGSSAGIAIIDTFIVQPTCGLANGSIALQFNEPSTVTEILMNGNTASLNSNIALSEGQYNFQVMDSDGCTDTISLSLEPSLPVEITQADTIGTTCNLENGQVFIQSVGAPTEYSIDGITYFPQDSFINLADGPYTLYARNDNCADTSAFVISASTLPSLVVAMYDDTSCGESNGVLELDALNGTGPYEYILDTITNETGVFNSLPGGEYVVFVEDFNDCRASNDASIEDSDAVSLSAVVTDGVCGELGSIELSAQGGNGDFEYSDESQQFSDTSVLNNLEEGEYVFYLRDSDGCLDTIKRQVEVYKIPELTFSTTDATCEEPVGTISLTGTEGKGELSYAPADENFSTETSYRDLAEGNYTFIVRDESGCTSQVEIEVAATPAVNVENIDFEQLFCGDFLTEINFTPTGGTGQLSTRLYDASGAELDLNQGIGEGQYRLVVTDELGCELRELIVVRKEDCSIYIPTAFDPNASAGDTAFRLGVPKASSFIIESFRIYDRWGNLVYDKENIDPLTFVDWWDGTLNGRAVEQGVYTYVVRLGGEKADLLSGNVTLVR